MEVVISLLESGKFKQFSEHLTVAIDIIITKLNGRGKFINTDLEKFVIQKKQTLTKP